MTYTINREKFKTEKGKILYDKLLEISEDTNFLVSVLIDVQGDERKTDLLNWLANNKSADADDVLDYVDDKYN